jgi:hypothetical protein
MECRGLRIMRIRFALFPVTLLSCLLIQPAIAQNSEWQTVKALPPSQQLRVSLQSGKTHQGELLNIGDDTLTLISGQILQRQDIRRVWVKRGSKRGKHTLNGAGIGAGVGLGLGAAIDNSCSQNSIICTGNRGKAIGAPVFALLGAGIGAALPSKKWHEVYRSR